MIEITEKLCHSIVDFFIKEKIFSEEQRDIYQYGFELCVSSVISIAVVLAIGIISGKFLESVVFYIVFCFTRLFGGGFHAPTYLLCKITFISVLLAVLALDWLLGDIADFYWYILYFYSLIIVCCLAPVENHNKPLTEREKVRNRIFCIIEMVIWLAVMLLLSGIDSKLYHIVALTLFFVANLMPIGKLYERRKMQ